MRRRIAVLAGAALIAGCGSSPKQSNPTGGPATPPAPVRAAACGSRTSPPARFDHVVWIWFENQSYEDVIGQADAPYTTGLATACGSATNFHNITHPSLPNYVAATTGIAGAGLRRYRFDCAPSPACSSPGPSIFDQARSWRAYQEDMPGNCVRENRLPLYVSRHNPPPYLRELAAACETNDVPYTRLAADLRAGTLPRFSFITPNFCNDTHDCPVATGDRWLTRELPRLTRSTTYREGRTAIFITWDEGRTRATDDCTTNTSDRGCHIAAIVVSPYTPRGATSATLFNHYSLLRTTEELLGLGLLGEAADATSMRSAFGLAP